jgi:L-histidine N-alpha-methyltransferase
MDRSDAVAIEVHLDSSGALASMAREVREGLARTPKRLPSKYFYDERGSNLFERITDLPEYYLTRAEWALLEGFADEIAQQARPRDLIELGPGSAKKTRVLIEAGRKAGTLRRYVPLEVSPEVAAASAQELADDYPGLAVHAVVGDFESHLDELPEADHQLIALLGSTIGNFPAAAAATLLSDVAGRMSRSDWFLLGTDLVKPVEQLEAAYNDSEGITAEFNRNILNVLNHHLDGDFDTGRFEHVAYFNAAASRIESYLKSVDEQTFRLEGLGMNVHFERGEMVRTEVSCKYTEESTRQMLAAAGLELVRWFSDEQQRFALSLSRLL